MRDHWRETEATVTSVVEQRVTGYGTTYEVVFTYKVDGRFYATTICTFKSHFKGEKIQICYDPADPDRNNLARREKLKKWGYAAFFTALAAWVLYLYLHRGIK